MNQNDRCLAIVETILALVNEGKEVKFVSDMGRRDAMTIVVDNKHTHVGGKFPDMIRQLSNYLSQNLENEE